MKKYLKTGCHYLRDQKSQSGKPIRFYNWIGETGSFWFEKFIHSRKIPCSRSGTIAFFSVFGKKFPIRVDKSRVKVFFTGENLNRNEFGFSFQDYSDCLQNKYFDLSLGFDYLESDKYLRFPLWILYFVDPEDTSDAAIKTLCKRLSDHTLQDIHTKRFCSLVSGHDPNGLRREIYNSLKSIDRIDCSGRFLHNSDELKKVFNDDKIRYLEQFKFNICPENSNSPGYVTEKIVGAVFAGAIPVYWGSDNHPEPEFLNQNAIIHWDKDGDNTKNIDFIRSLNQNSQLYKDFYAMPRLTPHSSEFLSDTLWELECRLRFLVAAEKSD